MSPTSRRLRKKGYVEDKYGLQEFTERLSLTDDDGGASATVHSNVVLGSASVTKRKILEDRGWIFTVLEANRDLAVAVGKSTTSPLQVAKTIAHTLLPYYEDAEKPVVLITSAQVFKIRDSVKHPPADEAEAIELWQSVSGQTVQFVSAVVATVCPGGQQVSEIAEATVSFQTISRDMAARLAKRNFTLNSKNFPILDAELKLRCRIETGNEDTVMGLPVSACEHVLKAVLEMVSPELVEKLTSEVPHPPSLSLT